MLYKYRSANSFRYLADILVKKRLHAAPYSDLNDPMEGFYLASRRGGKLDEHMRRTIQGKKEAVRICSLSKAAHNPVMWSHYAEGSRGVVIGVEVTDSRCDTREVKYADLPPKISLKNYSADTAKDILSTKLSAWRYEEEVRIFVEGRHYVDVALKELYWGSRMSAENRSFLVDFCKKVCPDIRIISASTGYA